MNQGSVNTETALNVRHSEFSSDEEYTLHSDLAKFCLPSAANDPNRKYGWANSICFLFLVIGLIGLKSPELITKQLTPVTDIVPVIFTPPPEEQPPPSEPQPQTTRVPGRDGTGQDGAGGTSSVQDRRGGEAAGVADANPATPRPSGRRPSSSGPVPRRPGHPAGSPWGLRTPAWPWARSRRTSGCPGRIARPS